ncbi:hypothetical protein IT570_00520 [Candidatus Sumerlaeota bacterium]|nr:hypothetical protein [Candidatus Sumerlaeota bacterium]
MNDTGTKHIIDIEMLCQGDPVAQAQDALIARRLPMSAPEGRKNRSCFGRL